MPGTEEGSAKGAELDKIIKEHGGLISRDMARGILENGSVRVSNASAQEVCAGKFPEGGLVSVEDHVYKISNKKRFERNGLERFRRTLVLGSKGSTVVVSLWDKQADLADSLLIERGDRVLASNLRVRKAPDGYELSSISSTYLSRLSPSETQFRRFLDIKAGERDIDLVCKVVAVSPIRYFMDLNGGQSGVSDCTVTDGLTEARLTMWRSSSQYAATLHPGNYIKAESIDVREREGLIEFVAGDSSRVLVSNKFKPVMERA